MRHVLFIALGGAIGSVFRFLIAKSVNGWFPSGFPYGTFVVNLAGCFAIGCLIAFLERTQSPASWSFFLVTGVCGGFTTFSAFAYENLALIQNGQTVLALLYALLSLIIGTAAAWAGFALCQ